MNFGVTNVNTFFNAISKFHLLYVLGKTSEMRVPSVVTCLDAVAFSSPRAPFTWLR